MSWSALAWSSVVIETARLLGQYAEVFVTLVWTRLSPFRAYGPRQGGDALPDREPVDEDALRDAVRLARATDRVAWALFDGPSCLWRAQALVRLLSRRGLDTTLRYGVCKDHDAPLRFHAWVELGGMTLIGDLPDLSRYRPLV